MKVEAHLKANGGLQRRPTFSCFFTSWCLWRKKRSFSCCFNNWCLSWRFFSSMSQIVDSRSNNTGKKCLLHSKKTWGVDEKNESHGSFLEQLPYLWLNGASCPDIPAPSLQSPACYWRWLSAECCQGGLSDLTGISFPWTQKREQL